MIKTQLHLISITLIICIFIMFNISARGCVKRNSDNKAGSSNDDTFMINAPSNLAATAVSSSQINLFWQDNSNNEDGFSIERKNWANGTYNEIATVGIDVVSYSDSGLSLGITYYYRIRAFNTIGDYSSFSNEASVNTVSNVVLSGISAGGYYTIARSAEGNIFVWGYNDYFQLGLGDLNTRSVPVPIGSETDWSLISAGFAHTIAMKNDRTIWGMGANSLGQLGLGATNFDGDVPYWIGPDADFALIAAAGNNAGGSPAGHTLALRTNGTLWGCGLNGEGQLGIGIVTTYRSTLTQIGTDSDWASMTGGYGHSLAIRSNPAGGRTLWSWGRNNEGQLGDGSYFQRISPRQVGTDSDWSTVTAGNVHTLAIKTVGTLWSWGQNWNGQLGLGDSTRRNTPSQVGIDSDWSGISGNGQNINEGYSVAIKNGGTIWGWGWNGYGQLGLGDVTGRKTPTQIGTQSDWSTIAVGRIHVVASKTNGTLWSWGGNIYGQLGLGDTINRSTPSLISFGLPEPPYSLNSIIINSTRVDLSWVDIAYNEEGFKIERKLNRDGSYEQIVVLDENTISYSDIISSGLLPNTTYYYRIRSYNTFGNSIYSNETWVAVSGDWSLVASDELHTIGLKTNGIMWAWGTNDYGQLGLGDAEVGINRNIPTVVGTNSDWSIIKVGYGFTIAHKTNKTLWAWGTNDACQLGLGYAPSEPAQIGTDSDWSIIAIGGLADPGKSSSRAIKTNGTLWTWGNNDLGQLGLGDAEVGITKEFPVQVGGDSDWSNIGAGPMFVVAVKTIGTLWSWGDNEHGQLGLDYEGGFVSSPIQVGLDTDWFSVSCGGDSGQGYAIAIKTNRTIWSWGYDSIGQLGLGTTGTRKVPTQIVTGKDDSDWFMVSSGYAHSIALKTNGSIWVWGANGSGQLGLGNFGFGAERTEPTQVGDNSDWILVSSGTLHSFAIKTNKILWAWGYNNNGQLGLGDNTNRNVPTLVGE